jgi:hypothetical protein
MRMNRRNFLKCTGGCVAGTYPALTLAAQLGDAHVLAPRPTHFPPRARHLIFVFLTGGFSHVDTFDEKPRLATDHGRVIPSIGLRGTSRLPLLRSPFRFQSYGRSGLRFSELFKNLSVSPTNCA